MATPDLPKDTAKCVSPIPVPTHGAGGVFTVACSTTIAAPALTVLEKVLDLSGYPAWNTFVPTASVTTPGTLNFTEETQTKMTPELRALVSRPGYVGPGAKIRFHAVMVPGGASRAVDLEVTFLETFDVEGKDKVKGYRVVWKVLGMPHFLLHSERVQEFVESVAADGSVETRYASWETFGGLIGYVLPRAQIEGGFNRWTNGLKKAAEEAK
jgi:hypothetical protein